MEIERGLFLFLRPEIINQVVAASAEYQRRGFPPCTSDSKLVEWLAFTSGFGDDCYPWLLSLGDRKFREAGSAASKNAVSTSLIRLRFPSPPLK